jgi:hypothetical protein
MSDDKKLFSSYEDLVKHLSENKLNSYTDLQNIEWDNMNELIGKRYGRESIGSKSPDVQKFTNEILEQDYPALNKARNAVGLSDLKASYGNIRGGVYVKAPNKSYDNDIYLGSDKMNVLGHEIGHANDDISQIIRRVAKSGDTAEADRVRNILTKDSSPSMRKFLSELDETDHGVPLTSNALQYDRPKLEAHLKLLESQGELSPDLKRVKNAIKSALVMNNDKNNMGKRFKEGDNLLRSHIKNWEEHFIPLSTRSSHQYGTDYGLNKQISDLVPDNSILMSNSDNHHAPRLDTETGKMDKGNWEHRNLKRGFLGKGLKALPWIGAGAALLGGDIASAASIFDPTDPSVIGEDPNAQAEMDAVRVTASELRGRREKQKAEGLLLERNKKPISNNLLMRGK